MRRALVLNLVAALLLGTGAAYAQAPADTARPKPPARQRFVSSNVLPMFQTVRIGGDLFTQYDIQFYKEPVLKKGQKGWRRRLGLLLTLDYEQSWADLDPGVLNRYSRLLAGAGLVWGRERVWQLSNRLRMGLGPTVTARYGILYQRVYRPEFSAGGKKWELDYMEVVNEPGLEIGLLGSANWQAAPWFMLGADVTLTQYTYLYMDHGYNISYNNERYDDGQYTSLYSNLRFRPLYRISASFRIQ